MSDLIVRPMRPDDIEDVEEISAVAFLEADRRRMRPGEPEPTRRSAASAEIWMRRTRHLLATDPGGCWVAEQGGVTLGLAISMRRELMWILATYAVLPEAQGRRIGSLLFEAAATHARGCLRGMLAASDDPRALRRYRMAGFDLHPQLYLQGRIDPESLLQAPRRTEYVRPATTADIDLMDSLDRRTRQAAHGSDHEIMLELFDAFVIDRPAGQGYAYASADQPQIIAASDRRTAQALLWSLMARAEAGRIYTIPHVTGANQWAVEAGVRAGLSIGTRGHLAVRGMAPPAPYLHQGAVL